MALGIGVGIGIENGAELLLGESAHAGEASDQLARQGFGDGMGALGRVLGEIADALEIRGHPDRHHDLAQVAGHGLALGDGEDRLVLDLLLEDIDLGVAGDDPVGELGVAPDDRIDGVGELLLGEPAHLGQHGFQGGEIFVVGLDNMIGHSLLLGRFSRNGR
jgi:hypothetical protein